MKNYNVDIDASETETEMEGSESLLTPGFDLKRSKEALSVFVETF